MQHLLCENIHGAHKSGLSLMYFDSHVMYIMYVIEQIMVNSLLPLLRVFLRTQPINHGMFLGKVSRPFMSSIIVCHICQNITTCLACLS